MPQYMIKTSLISVGPLAGKVRKCMSSFSIIDQVEIEEYWRKVRTRGVDFEHVYASTNDKKFQIVAAKLFASEIFVVGINNVETGKLIIVSTQKEKIRIAVAPAFLVLGPLAERIIHNKKWKWTGEFA